MRVLCCEETALGKTAMKLGRNLRWVLAGIAVVAVCASTASAQTFPSKPIKLVIPAPAGSGPDLIYRPVAEHLTRTLGQSVIMDLRPGGGTMVAALHVKEQPPDGYTIYVASNALTLRSVIPNAQIDVRKDFTPIAPSGASPLVIAVNSEQIRATTIKELLDEARARPGQINYASYGVGSGAHMFMEMLLNEAKVKMVHVPYQSSAQAAAETAAGRVQVVGNILVTLQPYIAAGGSGKIRPLAVTVAERSPLLPDLPGMKESGFPQLDYPVWGGFVGPAGMSRSVVDTLNRALNAADSDPKIVAMYARFGSQTTPGTPEDLKRIIDLEFNAYEKLIRETGLKLD
jgi:tripartite-type tricarboxylate transporter receptor subunit TctC